MRVFLGMLCCSVAFSAYAQSEGDVGLDAASARSYLAISVGDFDTFDDENSLYFSGEWRMPDSFHGLRPTVGVSMDMEGGTYAYGGGNWDIALGDSAFYLTPSLMAGLYSKSSSKDLGGAVQFRSGLEASYMFDNHARVGLGIHHISNASIYDTNPGAETIYLNYQHPFF